MTVHVSQLVESVSANCVGLKPSANSFRPQPPSSSSTTASLSSGLTTTTAYWRVYTLQTCHDRRMSDYISNFFIRIVADKGYDSRREIFYSSHGLLRTLATVLSLSQEPLNGTAFPIM